MLGGSRKLGGAVEHSIDGSEKRICRLSFEFWSPPHVIERRSNALKLVGGGREIVNVIHVILERSDTQVKFFISAMSDSARQQYTDHT